MRQYKKVLLGVASIVLIIVLAACGNIDDSSSSTSSSGKKTTSVQTTGQVSKSEYAGVIKNGHYLTSKARGLTANRNSNSLNITSFENGLLGVSKSYYSTSNYIFQEGQYLTTAKLTNWLGRKSKSNPTGLNPKDNGKKNSSRNPIYVESIEEQDFMQKNGNSLVLKGITIGIAMNTIDYYQKIKYGVTYQQTITSKERVAYGKKVAKLIVERMRKIKKIGKNVPITIAMYKQAANDSLVGGSFYAKTQTTSSNISNWEKMNVENKVFPEISSTSDYASNDNKSFENFQSQIENYFPTISDVTAQAKYVNKKIAGEQVTITTQFYSETEIISFTNFIAQVAPKFLPSGVPVNITVNSANGIQAFLSRSSTQRNFKSHVFSSY
ncbi:CamS family sex pheromone protein [Periweissella beninensis]|uniref:CamS family sex pheromone protein n=1 Tax=Periweissella beninensis TaxID=504936 RepID=UPI0021A2CD25|nr:CamS family sex pheromone protein [Periweissella beninensis]MCT4395807.1 CamS family sex pheromone protein [Periweissella beninensis]